MTVLFFSAHSNNMAQDVNCLREALCPKTNCPCRDLVKATFILWRSPVFWITTSFSLP
uniref:Phlebovirus glycoprotein G2 fusion domain-containing protein n=1 Tax=Heterorhabditis bacteriophora TaxID=37862 RepID=A0A1I7WGX6_HETBA